MDEIVERMKRLDLKDIPSEDTSISPKILYNAVKYLHEENKRLKKQIRNLKSLNNRTITYPKWVY